MTGEHHIAFHVHVQQTETLEGTLVERQIEIGANPQAPCGLAWISNGEQAQVSWQVVRHEQSHRQVETGKLLAKLRLARCKDGVDIVTIADRVGTQRRGQATVEVAHIDDLSFKHAGGWIDAP